MPNYGYSEQTIRNYAKELKDIEEQTKTEEISEVIALLNKIIDVPTRQLEEKDKQIRNRDNQISQLIETNKALSVSNAAKSQVTRKNYC